MKIAKEYQEIAEWLALFNKKISYNNASFTKVDRSRSKGFLKMWKK